MFFGLPDELEMALITKFSKVHEENEPEIDSDVNVSYTGLLFKCDENEKDE